MAEIHPYVWVPAYRVVVCKECRYANTASEVQSHLRGRNHTMKRKEAGRVVDAIQKLPGIYQDQSQLRTFEYPSPIIPAIPILQPAKQDGMVCGEYEKVLCQENKMRNHYIQVYGWKNPRTIGGT